MIFWGILLACQLTTELGTRLHFALQTPRKLAISVCICSHDPTGYERPTTATVRYTTNKLVRREVEMEGG